MPNVKCVARLGVCLLLTLMFISSRTRVWGFWRRAARRGLGSPASQMTWPRSLTEVASAGAVVVAAAPVKLWRQAHSGERAAVESCVVAR
jgi:hypothetical protein